LTRRLVAYVSKESDNIENERFARAGRLPEEVLIENGRTLVGRAPNLEQFGVGVVRPTRESMSVSTSAMVHRCFRRAGMDIICSARRIEGKGTCAESSEAEASQCH
jgi:hypothetical protein